MSILDGHTFKAFCSAARRFEAFADSDMLYSIGVFFGTGPRRWLTLHSFGIKNQSVSACTGLLSYKQQGRNPHTNSLVLRFLASRSSPRIGHPKAARGNVKIPLHGREDCLTRPVAC